MYNRYSEFSVRPPRTRSCMIFEGGISVFHRRVLLFLAFALLLLTLASCENDVRPPETTVDVPTETEPETEPQTESSPAVPVKVILLSGQSNMTGYTYDTFRKASPFAGERLEKANAGYQNVLIRFCNNPYIEGERIENDAFEPTTFGCGCLSHYEGFRSFGPELSIAETLANAYPDETFYLVKCSTSGANLYDQFNPDNRDKAESLYAQLVTFTKDALSCLVAEGLAPEIIAFCWIQGEGDGDGEPDAYLVRFRRFLDSLKADLAAYMPENGMAVIDGGLKDSPNLNAVKEQFAAESSKRFFFPTTDMKNGGNLHFDCDSMITIGERFGERLLTVIQTLSEPEILT